MPDISLLVHAQLMVARRSARPYRWYPPFVPLAVVVHELLTVDDSTGCIPRWLVDDLRVRAGDDDVPGLMIFNSVTPLN